MNLTQLVQLYAPLAGLLIMAAWLGALSQRVKDLIQDVKELREGGDAITVIDRRLTRIETLMEGHGKEATATKRAIEGVQRQLGNLMMRGPSGSIVEFSSEKE